MKALTFKRYGKSPDIGFVDIPRPTAGPTDMVVRVHAAGLNPIDAMLPGGDFKPLLPLELPATLGSDVAGVVVEVGRDVTRFKPGDAIFASTFGLGPGTLAEFVRVPEAAAAPKPARLDFVQAASLPMVALTAWQALVERAGLRAGETVYIQAGSGGVGTIAIQLARHLGATVSTSVGSGGIALARRLGATTLVDYTRERAEEVLRDHDVVLGTQRGGAVEASAAILRPGGRLVSLVGPVDAAFARARGLPLVVRAVLAVIGRKMRRLAKARGLDYGFVFVRADGAQLAQLGRLVEDGAIEPVIDRVFAFDQALEALQAVAAGRAKGKIVVRMD